MQFAAGQLPEPVMQSLTSHPADQVLMALSGIFFQGKFYTIFSFLFGLSFALQLTGAARREGHFLVRYGWRLLLLGAIGLLHHIHWRGDILSIYAGLGFALLPFRNIPDKWLVAVALLLVLNVPARLTDGYRVLAAPVPPTASAPAGDAVQAAAERYYDLIKHGSYGQTLRENFYAFRQKMAFQVDSGRLYMTLGFFLLGLYAGRRRFFESFDTHKSFFRKLCRYSGFATLALIAAALLLFLVIRLPENGYTPLLGGLIFDTGNAALTLFYLAGVTLLFGKPTWAKKLAVLAPVGRMGLTNYLLQTVIGLVLFQGYALNLMGEIGVAFSSALALPVFALQVQYSKWWLARFRYGPLEWLWRSGTYLQRQPFVRRAVPEAAVA
ncbi:MAG: DUF418 domain-containing protein [Cytophagales bacterium]|nr:DUF418 domain-containing protein [Cytophagales bacterium]